MANFRPFSYQIPSGNSPVLETGKGGPMAPKQPEFTSGKSALVNPLSSSLANIAGAAAAAGGFIAFGQSKFKGQKGWDYYHTFAKNVEDFSPAGVLRTFQVSKAIQPFTTQAQATRILSGPTLKSLANTAEGWMWLDNFEKVTGHNLASLGAYEKGIVFKNGSILLGGTSQVLLKHAFVVDVAPGQLSALQKGYIRSVAGSSWYEGEDLIGGFAKPMAWQTEKGIAEQSAFFFAGGQTRRQAAGRFLGGYGTALVERINQLARSPAEIEPFASIFKRLPISFGVRSSSGLRTLARITGKLGIAGGVAYGAYSYLDYATRKAESLDQTVFAEGSTAGAATLWTKARLGIAKAGEALGAQDYVKRQEELAPRSTSLGTLAAFPLMGLLAAGTAGYGQRIIQAQGLRRAGWSTESAMKILSKEDDLFKTLLEARYPGKDPLAQEAVEKRLLRSYGMRGAGGKGSFIRSSLETLIEGEALTRAEKSIQGPWGKIAGKIAAYGTEGDSLGRRLVRKMGYMTPGRLKALTGVGVGLGLILPFLPGALLPEQRPEELEAIYSGRKSIPVRKGRWWEFGRSPYEGENIMYYRPHWYPRMLARGREKAIYGEEELSPLQKFYMQNFTYDLEKKHYFDRPYPVSGAAFQDVPFIGPLLAATVGRLVKPPRLMHEGEWRRATLDAQSGESALEYAKSSTRLGYKEAPPEAGGESPEGAPISPYGIKGVIGEQAYRMTEMIGLPGFTMGSIKERLTGEETLFAQEQQLESAQRMFGAERAYWDLEIGGGLGTTELFRRLYPHRRREIPLYNPIGNTMPEWLPGPGERSPDFRHGDPYAKVQEGEIRLPGPGYAAFNPELQGTAPEDYPLIHRYKILADIAPYSTQFDRVANEIKALNRKKALTEQEQEIFDVTREQLKAKKQRKTFYPYQFKERAYATESERLLAEYNKATAEAPEPSAVEGVFGRYWEFLAHHADTPLETLTPLSPYSKLVHVRTALEDYEANQVYGTKNAFWGNPYRDFLRPFGSRTAAAVGADDLPEVVKGKRETEEYFDMLKYVKYTALERKAQAQEDTEATQEFAAKRRETLFGVDPYTYNYSQIFRALPRRERDYFNQFVKADLDERQRLLEVLPDNEKELYKARWQLEDISNSQKAIKKGLLTSEQAEKVKSDIDAMYEQRSSEGMPIDKQLWAEYLETRLPQESYADWYRRTYLLAEKLDGKPLPGPDWVGWHPMVDMEDIKLKVVQGRKENPIDYDIWPEQERLLARRPGVAEGAQELSGTMSAVEVRRNIEAILKNNGLAGANVSITPSRGNNSVNMHIKQDRGEDIAYIGKKDNLG